MIHFAEPYLNSYDLYNPTRIIFGAGVLKKLHEYPIPGKKALICLDSDPFTKKLGYLSTLQAELEMAGCTYAVFDQIQPNPVLTTVHAGRNFLLKNNCDFLVSLGGGSTHDTAKGIAIMATNPGSLWDYMYGRSGGGETVENAALPLIAISTTAGTGSEVANGLVITNEATGEKNSFKHPSAFPVYCFEDPEIQTSVPPRLTAFQAYDALSHCVEGFLMRRSNLMSDMFTIDAIENCIRYLPRAVRNGKDMEARTRIAQVAMLSGWCMNIAGTSSLHPLEHVLSEFNHKLAHGCGLIILSQAYYSRQVAIHTCDERFIQLARAFGRTDATRPEEFLEMHAKFLEEIGCNNFKMSDYGLTPELFPDLIKNARASSPYFETQDRVPLTDDDLMKILTEAYQ